MLALQSETPLRAKVSNDVGHSWNSVKKRMSKTRRYSASHEGCPRCREAYAGLAGVSVRRREQIN